MKLASLPRPVLVTGASGFLGEHLCRYLARRGVVVAGTFLTHEVRIPGADLVPVDLRDGRAVSRLIRDLRPSAVIHAAAVTNAGFCEREPESARAAIVDVTGNIARAIGERAPETPVVALSTDLVFDGEGAPYGEEAEARPLMVYGRCKLEAEEAVLGLAGGAVVRTALLYGAPTQHAGSFLAWMRRTLERGERLTLFRDEVRTPLFVEDLCGALAGLLEGGHGGLFHAGGPERLSREEMGRRVCEVFGYDAGLLDLVSLGEATLDTPRPRDVSLECGKLAARIGFKPRGFGAGLIAVRDFGPEDVTT